MNNASNCSCEGAACDTTPNKPDTCGLQIRNGTSCGCDNGETVGVWYYNTTNTTLTNPWTGANGA